MFDTQPKARKIHMCASVRGLLRRPRRELDRMFVDPATGKKLRAEAAIEFLFDALARGHEVIPLSRDCDNFDFKTGCLGHELEIP